MLCDLKRDCLYSWEVLLNVVFKRVEWCKKKRPLGVVFGVRQLFLLFDEVRYVKRLVCIELAKYLVVGEAQWWSIDLHLSIPIVIKDMFYCISR